MFYCWCSAAAGPAAASAERSFSFIIQQSKFCFDITCIFALKGQVTEKIFGLTEVLEWHICKKSLEL